MKHSLHILPPLVVAAALALSPACFAEEAPAEVLFDGSSHKIAITPAEDLFGEGTKNMMPGDSFTGTVRLRATGTQKTELFLTAAPTDGLMNESLPEDLGSRLGLTVRLLNEGSAPRVLYEGSLAGVIDPRTSLGVYADGTARNLEFTVSVPTTLGNDYQSTSAATKWTFYAEQRDEPGGDDDEPVSDEPDSEPLVVRQLSAHPRAPQTGAQRASLAVLAGGTVLCGAGFVVTRRKKSKR